MKHDRSRKVGPALGLGLMLLLLGCGAEIAVEEEDVQTSFTLLTISGGEFTMDGTWLETCNNNGPNSEVGELTFSGLSGSSKKFTWTGFNNCTGITPVLTSQDSFEIDVSGTKAAGWFGAPPAGLASTMTVSTFRIIAGGVVGDSQIGVVDDTVSPPRAYFGDGDAATDAEGYPIQLEVFPTTRVQ